MSEANGLSCGVASPFGMAAAIAGGGRVTQPIPRSPLITYQNHTKPLKQYRLRGFCFLSLPNYSIIPILSETKSRPKCFQQIWSR